MKHLLIFLLFTSVCVSQVKYPQDYFRNPLDLNIILSGTFGELRSNHFHSGLDIKTNQVEGLKVYTSAAGYVSRIKISHFGYGKALYITHPNGYTTVYAHLQKFSPTIEAYIKALQYQKESYQVEVFPTPNELPIAQNELVAFSGNTGSSGAPHLHFEIRDNAERPMNPMLFGIEVPDSKKPTILGLFAYPKDLTSHINGVNKKVELRLVPTKNGDFTVEHIEANGDIGFGIIAYDKLDGAYNKNGVSLIQTFYNGNKNFEIDFKRFSFSESKHINRFIDFEHYKTERSRIQKLFRLPKNPLSMYKELVNEGYLKIEDSTASVYKIRVADFKGNDTWITIPIQSSAPPQQNQMLDHIRPMHYAAASQVTTLKKGPVSVYFPANTFYDDTYLDFNVTGDTLLMHKDVVPLLKKYTITYDVSNYNEADIDKLYIAELVGFYKRPNYVSTSRKGNQLIAYTKSLGTYTLQTDSTPPTITPINVTQGKWMSKAKSLNIKIEDNESGISNYRATINGQWILMEYEYKTNTLTYNFNDAVINDTENNFKLIVTDNVGNSTTFETTFFRK